MWRTEEERRESAAERLRLAKSLWGWEAHPAQRRWFVDTAQIRVAACGRRWGKTECLSIDVASLALAEAAAGRDCRQLVVAPTDWQARLLGEAVADRVRAAFEGDPTVWTAGLALDIRQRPCLQITVKPEGIADPILSNHRRVRGGGPAISRVLCRTAARDGSSLRGLWAHRIVVDEASRVPDTVMTEVLLPMLMDVGGEYTLASSPFGRRSAFYRLFAKSQAGGVGDEGVTFAGFQCPTSDNPHNDKSFLAAMRDELGDAMYAQEILAEFTDDGGAVFREDDIGACLAADSRTALVGGDLVSDPQPGRLYAAGIDWGRKVDYTVVCIVDATDTPARLVQLQRWHGTGWDAQIRAVAETLARFNPVRVLADGNSIGDPLIEALGPAARAAQKALGRHDPRPLRLERFTFTPESKLRLVDHLTLGLAGRRLTFPLHRALLSELRGFEYGLSGASGRATMAARGSGHDDCVMALALAWYCAPEAAPAPPAARVLLGSQLGYGRERW